MQVEPMPEADQYRCWLSEREQELLVNYYDDDPRRQLAVELMLDGLRSEEVPRVTAGHVRRLDTDMEAYKLRIPQTKTGYRQAPVSRDTVQKMRMIKNIQDLRKDEAVISVSPRTVQRWVADVVADIATQDDNGDWHQVTAHDLRRTWATHTYYSLGASPVSRDIVMRWGGWSDPQTFRENYLGREPDGLAAELMEDAGLR